MSWQPAAAHGTESRRAILFNWLALAALLALGFFAAPARAAEAAPVSPAAQGAAAWL